MQATKEEAYNAGANAGEFGTDLYNCHEDFFVTEELRKEWERGRYDAEWPSPKLVTKRSAAIIKIAPNLDESFHD